MDLLTEYSTDVAPKFYQEEPFHLQVEGFLLLLLLKITTMSP